METAREFCSNCPDVSAAIWNETNIKPTVRAGKSLVEIVFPDTESVRNTVYAYSGGNLRQDVRAYAAKRGQLFKMIRQCASTGGAR